MALAQTVALLLSLIPLTGVVLLLQRHIRQRSLRKIPGPSSASYLTGNFAQFFIPSALNYQDHLTDTYGRLYKIHGYLGEQMLVTSDLKALYQVVVKNVDVFDSAETFLEWVMHVAYAENLALISIRVTRLQFGKGLLSAPMAGDVHKRQRRLMNPAFSAAHIKRMSSIFSTISKQLREVLTSDIEKSGREETDIMEVMGKAALELIAQAGFGYTFGALEGAENDYSYALKRLVPNSARLFKYRPMLPFLTRHFPPWLLRAAGKLLPSEALHQQFDLVDILTVAATDIWKEKTRLHALGEKASNRDISEGRDILSILLQENDRASSEDRLPDDEIIGQINTFLFAGTDTTSNAVSRILHMLALNTDVQDNLRKELADAGAPDNLDYDLLDRLPYLEAICRETLRLFPPVRFLQRVARRDHLLSLQQPVVDVNGTSITEVFIPKGTAVFCNIAAVNTDPDIWGIDAHEWKPERWLNPLPQSVIEAHIPGIYTNMLTFAGGSRSCIGFKFSQLEMKTILSQLLPTFCFRPSTKHEIKWRFGGIITPATAEGFSGTKAELPLRISVL